MKLVRWLTLLCILSLLTLLPVYAEAPLTNETPHEIARLGRYGEIFGLEWSPDGAMLAVNAVRGIVIYNERLELLRFIERPNVYWPLYEGATNAVIAWSFNSRYIASDESPLSGNMIFIWDAVRGSLQSRLTIEPGTILSQLVWSNDGQWLAAARHNGAWDTEPYTQIMVWWLATGQLIASHLHESIEIELISWTENNQLLTARHGDLQVYLSARTADFADKAPRPLPLRGTSPDGHWRADCDVELTLVEVGLFGVFPLDNSVTDSRFTCASLRWSSDSSQFTVHFVLPDENHTPRIATFNVQDGQIASAIDAQYISADHMAFHPGGSLLAGSNGAVLQLWNMATGTKLAEEMLTTGTVFTADWSPDSHRVVMGTYQGVWIWDILTGKPVLRLAASSNYSIPAWSPDGRWIAEVSEQGLNIYDAETGAQIYQMKFPSGSKFTDSIVWREDSQQVATIIIYPDEKSLIMGRELQYSLLVYDIALDDFVNVLTPPPGRLVNFSREGTLTLQYQDVLFTRSINAKYDVTRVIPHPPTIPDIPWQNSDLVAVRSDGHYVALFGDGNVHVFRILEDMSLAEAGTFNTTPNRWVYTRTLSWSPDGKYLLADGMNGPLVVLGEFGD